MKLQIKNNEQAVITIPKNLRKAKGWEGGEDIEFYLNDQGHLVMKESEN